MTEALTQPPPAHAGGLPTRAFWREALEPYASPDRGRSLRCLLTSVLPYLVLYVLMDMSLGISYLLTLALAVPAAGFLCAHTSSFTTARMDRS